MLVLYHHAIGDFESAPLPFLFQRTWPRCGIANATVALRFTATSPGQVSAESAPRHPRAGPSETAARPALMLQHHSQWEGGGGIFTNDGTTKRPAAGATSLLGQPARTTYDHDSDDGP